MEKVLFSGTAEAVPSHLIADDEVVQFIEVCKYLKCEITITEDGDDVFFRANVPEDILEKGYIEIQRRVIDLDVIQEKFDKLVEEITSTEKEEIMSTQNTNDQANTNTAGSYEELAKKFQDLEQKLHEQQNNFEGYKKETDAGFSSLKSSFKGQIAKESTLLGKTANLTLTATVVAAAAAGGMYAYDRFFKKQSAE